MYDPTKSQENYDPGSELSKNIEITDLERIKALLEKLEVELPENGGQNLEYELKGEISITHGFESNYFYDVTKGNTTRARFNGALEYEDEELFIDGIYEEEATKIFQPFDEANIDNKMKVDKIDKTPEKTV